MSDEYTQEDLRRHFEQNQDAFRRLNEEGAGIARQSRELPGRLYHYSDTCALMGMVENEELWATNAGFLNDEQELHWSATVFSEALAAVKPLNEGEDRLITQLGGAANRRFDEQNYYLVSFSEQRDDLPQWHGYGKGQGPVCISFHASMLTGKYYGYDFLSVLYEPDQQREIADKLVELMIRFYRERANEDNPSAKYHLIPQCAHSFRIMSTYAALRFKSPDWRSEKEWRLVATPNPSGQENDVHFRCGAQGLIPYMKLKPTSSAGLKGIGLDGVIVGPTHYRELARKSLSMYMRKMNAPLHEVVSSKIAMR